MARLGGLLLAGGRSSRFGSDKALAEVAGDTLLERGVSCLRRACDGPVLVASGDGASRPGTGDRQVADRVRDGGPLSAIAAGLADLTDEVARVAVLAVDHLTPSPQLFALLAGQPGAPACALAEVEERWQPLHAVWATSVAATLGAAVDAGERSVIGWLRGRDDVTVVPEVVLRATGIPSVVTRDVDRPEDLPR